MREHRILGCIPTEISQRDIAQAIGSSPQTAMRACRMLVDKGLIELRARHSDNGAQIANAYCATALGLEVARISEAVRGR